MLRLFLLGTKKFSFLINLKDTIKSPPPENKTMKKATFYGLVLTTIFYLLLGCIGYAAFGNDAPGNVLTGFGFYEPFWLVDIGNICVIIHFIGAYQVRGISTNTNINPRLQTKDLEIMCLTKCPFRYLLNRYSQGSRTTSQAGFPKLSSSTKPTMLNYHSPTLVL